MLSHTLALMILLLFTCLSKTSPVNIGPVVKPRLEKRDDMECMVQYGSPLYADCIKIISVMKTGFLFRLNQEIWDNYSYGSCTIDIRSEGWITWIGSWMQMSHNAQLLVDTCVGNPIIKTGGFRHLENGGDPGVYIRVSGYEGSPPILPDSDYKFRWERLPNGDNIQHYRAVPTKGPIPPTRPLSVNSIWSDPYYKNADGENVAAIAAAAAIGAGEEATAATAEIGITIGEAAAVAAQRTRQRQHSRPKSSFGIDETDINTNTDFPSLSSLTGLSFSSDSSFSASSIQGQTCSRRTDCGVSDICVYRPTHALLARLRASLRLSASGTRRASDVEAAAAAADSLPLWGVCRPDLGH